MPTSLIISTVLVLLVCFTSASLAAIQHSRPWLMSAVPCKVASPFDSPDVKAQLEREVEVQGCVTNNTVTVTETATELHVIHYHGNADDDVELVLTDVNNSGFDHPFIVILVSDVEVRWKVRMIDQPLNLDQHKFVVSAGSGLRFANKKMKGRPIISKPKLVPSDMEELLTWVHKQYDGVTSFSSFPAANLITLNIGIASSNTSGSPSNTKSSRTSPCVLHSNQEKPVNVKAITLVTQPVNGCQPSPRHSTFPTKLAYVIELQNVQYKKPFDVNLEIRRKSHQAKDKDFWLILKSPSHVTWLVHTKKVQGFINIVANNVVNMSGIRMHTVSVRSEELKESGPELLRWVEYFLNPVALYINVNDSNHISLTLPHIDDFYSPTHAPVPSKETKWKQKQIMETVRSTLTTECDRHSLTVAVERALIQALGIRTSSISLDDSRCIAEMNASHVFIHTARDTCGTSSIALHQGQSLYTNTLVIHSRVSISDEAHYGDSIEGSGLEDVFSGSGEGDSADLIMDDEDLELHPLKIGFKCETTSIRQDVITFPPHQPVTTFQLHLFENALFMAPFSRYPVTVTQPHTQLYLQSLSTADPHLRSHMSRCWLTPASMNQETQDYDIVRDGCGVEDSVQYLLNGVPQSERFRFTLENYVKQASTDRAELKCQLTLCCISRDCSNYNYPLCPEANAPCAASPRRHELTQTDIKIPSQLIVLGSLILPQHIQYDHVGDETTAPVSGETKDGDAGGKDKMKSEPVVIEGLDSGTVVGIAFAAFIIGAMMMGALWFIHTHTGALFSSGPFKRAASSPEDADNEEGYVETTPGSSAPIST